MKWIVEILKNNVTEGFYYTDRSSFSKILSETPLPEERGDASVMIGINGPLSNCAVETTYVRLNLYFTNYI